MRGIKRLAQHLDVSIGTVSRALNGKSDVSEATRARVLAAAEELGYVPNQAGRSLRKGATGVIGFMMRTGADITGQGDVFFVSMFDGIQSVFEKHQLDLVALLCSSQEDPDAFLRRNVERGFVDGLILSATRRFDSRIDFLSEKGIPFVTLGRSLSDAGQPWLDLDFEGMANIGVTRLARKGHKRIGVFAPDDKSNLGYVFVDAYKAALEKEGLTFDPDMVFRATPNERGGHEVAQRIAAMKDRPTGFILINEVMAVGLYGGLRSAGLEPGRDVAIIGRYSPHASFLTPQLTCFQINLRELGVSLAQNLLATMPAYAERYPQGVVRTIYPMELMVGESD